MNNYIIILNGKKKRGKKKKENEGLENKHEFEI